MATQLLEAPIKEIEFDGGRVYRATGDLGWGLFAGRTIRKGDTILVFRGEIISFDEAVAKGDWECWPLQFAHGKYIDLESPGCLANHSCEPNSAVHDEGNPTRVSLIALRDISQDEEIRYDYSTTMDEDSFTMPCRCGSEYCRQRVEDFKYLPLSVQEHNLRRGLVMDFISKKFTRSNERE